MTRRSGPSIPEAARVGQGRMTLRMPRPVFEALDRLAAVWGVGRCEAIVRAILDAEERTP